MSGIFQSAFRFASTQYKRIVRNRLAEYGLKYDDLLIETPEVMAALNRVDKSVLRERELRIRRAFDLSVKRKLIPPEKQHGDPLDRYLTPLVEEAKKAAEERAIINGY